MSDSQRSTDNSDHEVPRKQPSTAMTFGLFALLVVWVISIAIGTVLFGTVSEPPIDVLKVDNAAVRTAQLARLAALKADWRKPLLVVLPMALFLTLWAILLLRKRSRSSK